MISVAFYQACRKKAEKIGQNVNKLLKVLKIYYKNTCKCYKFMVI